MPQISPLCFSFLLLLLFSVLIPPAQSSLTLLNTTLEDATFYSVMPSAKFDHFPEHPFMGKLIPIKFLSGCELAPVPSFGGTPLVGIVTMSDAMEAGCVRVYHVAKGLQKNAAFVGLVVNTGASNTNNWFLNRDPFKDISDLAFAATEIDETTWKAIEPYVTAPGDGDTWVSVGQDLSPFIAAYEEPASQGIRFSLLALWALAGVLISAQIVVQNKEEWNFNTSAKVLFLSVYTCVCNVIYQAADPWGLMIERSLFVLPLFLSSLGAIYLCYAITVFKWVKIFNVFGHKSHFFKMRRPLVGVIICFTILLMGGTFFAIYFGFASMSLVLTSIFVCITPFQIAVFAVYGFKVTKSLSRSVDTTRSIEMRLARVRMFSLTVVAMLVWVFAFVVSVVTAVLGDGRDPDQKKLTQVLINVFFLLGVLSISATYAFAFYSRSLLGGSSHHDSSTGGTHPVSNSATATRRSVDRRGSTSTHQEDCDGSQITVPMSPMSTIKEYQIGDMAVEL